MYYPMSNSLIFFFNDTATTEIYTLSLHDALPILIPPSSVAGHESRWLSGVACPFSAARRAPVTQSRLTVDRKSTRLNSSHSQISYAVFCLKKKQQLH